MTREQKALTACEQYRDVSQRIVALTKAYCAARDKCIEPQTYPYGSCISHALDTVKAERRTATPVDWSDYTLEDSDLCDTCREAMNILNERKLLRLERGRVLRKINLAGKKETTNETD